MRRVKWGVLGCAAFARSTAIPAMLRAKNVELTGIASRSKEKAAAFAQEFGFARSYSSYEDLLADPVLAQRLGSLTEADVAAHHQAVRVFAAGIM